MNVKFIWVNFCLCVNCVYCVDQDDWNGTQRTVPGKAPPSSRGSKTSYREHPYRQYWSGLATLNTSPWLVPVYHGSSRFKQPDKSNCLFCIWFVCFFKNNFRTLDYLWESKLGSENRTCFFFFWDLTANSLPYLYFVSPPNQPATNPSNQSGF